MAEQSIGTTKELQKEIKRLRQRERNLIDGLMLFGDHPRNCRIWAVGLMNATLDDCSCGLWRLIGLPEGWRPWIPDEWLTPSIQEPA